ncbi:MAG: SAM-dependent methyltransferase [Pyrinomonadaceae bacterium]
MPEELIEQDQKQDFIKALRAGLKAGTFVKMTLGKYRGDDPNLQKLLIRLVKVKKKDKLFFLYRHQTRDTVKNHDFGEGVAIVNQLLGEEFMSAHLFTTANNFEIEFTKQGKSRLITSAPTFTQNQAKTHNKEKQRQIDPQSFYLRALGITNDLGQVKDKMVDKWKQVNKFIEIIGNLFENSSLAEKKEISIVDMGAGKGYLTFATYDYFNNLRKIKCRVTGVDTREELVMLDNVIARESGFEELNFERGFIRDFDLKDADILIALHACNTATDDALFKGITAGVSIIICAPCCHHQIRPQINKPEALRGVLKHGIMLEREAEMITDSLRALLLEQSGYATKLFEFVSTEHTPKNVMIVGTRRDRNVNTEAIGRQIEELKTFYGIREHQLEELLCADPAAGTTADAMAR